MNRRAMGWTFMAAGIACVLIFILLSLGVIITTVARAGGVLLYVGIAAIIVGIVWRFLAEAKPSHRRRY